MIQITAYDGVTGLPGQVVYSIVSGQLILRVILDTLWRD